MVGVVTGTGTMTTAVEATVAAINCAADSTMAMSPACSCG